MLDVLLVEDDHDLAATVVQYLELENIHCDHASNGVHGLQLLQKHDYDALLLDLNLPRLDGLTLCHTIRDQGHDIPVLMLTARDGLQDKLDGFRASSYQQYQGYKLHQRFDVLSYLTLSKAMDSHNLGRGRGNQEKALKQVQANALVIGIQSDVLFPVEEQAFLANHIPRARLELIDSIYGHDGFLIESEEIGRLVRPFVEGKAYLNGHAKYTLRQRKKDGFGYLVKPPLPGTERF